MLNKKGVKNTSLSGRSDSAGNKIFRSMRFSVLMRNTYQNLARK
jgi:hypothetical protein